MTVYHYDYKVTDWNSTLTKALGNVERFEIDSPETMCDGVLFLHGEVSEIANAAQWLLGRDKRYVVLVGSENPPSYRELDGAKDFEMKNWAFCPWSAQEFGKADSDAIKAFIESVVKNGKPDFSLFNPSVEYLGAIAILTQGYLIVHAMQGVQVELVPESLRRAAEHCSNVTVSVADVQVDYFWNVFDGKTATEIEAIARREWRGLGGGEDLDPNVKTLIGAVASPPPERFLPASPSATSVIAALASPSGVRMVAEAYTAIEVRMGASRGQ